MNAAHRSPSRTPTLLKVLAAYLVALLLTQSLAAAFLLGSGPLHQHHVPPSSIAVELPAVMLALFSHHGATTSALPTGTKTNMPAQHIQQQAAHGHAQAHETAERHHHAVGDPTVTLDAAAQDADQRAADAAHLALSAAFSLLALQTPRATDNASSHVLTAAAAWFWHTVAPLPLDRPPTST